MNKNPFFWVGTILTPEQEIHLVLISKIFNIFSMQKTVTLQSDSAGRIRNGEEEDLLCFNPPWGRIPF